MSLKARIRFKSTISRALLAIAVILTAAQQAAAQPDLSRVGVYMTLTTEYMNWGQSQTSGDGAVHVGIDYQHHSGFFAGGWASNVEYASEATRSKPREIGLDLYAGFGRRRESLSWAVALARYIYPDISVSYDYNELSGSVSFRDRLSYTATYTNDLLARGWYALNQEIGATLPLDWDMELGGSLGRLTTDDPRADDYTHWNIGISKIVSRFTVDLRFYDTRFDAVTHLGEPADKQWVLSLSYGFNSR